MTQVESLKSYEFQAVYVDGHSTNWMHVQGQTRTIWDTLEPMLVASKRKGFRPDAYKSYPIHHFVVRLQTGDMREWQVTPKFIREREARLDAEWAARA
jgi:hypothetical protein